MGCPNDFKCIAGYRLSLLKTFLKNLVSFQEQNCGPAAETHDSRHLTEIQ
jgi:hypothetical protein